MPRYQLTQSEYTLKEIAESFRLPLIALEQQHLACTYRMVLRFSGHENNKYLVQRYLNTCTLPFNEFFNHWLFDGDA